MNSLEMIRIDVGRDVPGANSDELQRKLTGSGCASWYLDAHDNNTALWPDFTFRFRQQTKRLDTDAYKTSPPIDSRPGVGEPRQGPWQASRRSGITASDGTYASDA